MGEHADGEHTSRSATAARARSGEGVNRASVAVMLLSLDMIAFIIHIDRHTCRHIWPTRTTTHRDEQRRRAFLLCSRRAARVAASVSSPWKPLRAERSD